MDTFKKAQSMVNTSDKMKQRLGLDVKGLGLRA